MAHEKENELTDVPPTAYRRDEPLARARIWVPGVVILAVLAAGAIGYFARGDLRYSPGSLAAVHATWDSQCQVCHVDAQPLDGKNWAAVVVGRTHAADAQCRQCHSGPAHHTRERPGEVAGCATCHREHQGRHAALTRVPDEQCTSCHRQLASHCTEGPPTEFADVSGWGSGHPEFRILRDKAKDPGTVAFNHQLHLRPGLTRVSDSIAPFTLAQIPAAFRDSFARWAAPDGTMKLDCAACHQTDVRDGPAPDAALAGLPHNAVLPARSDGAYMQPILYERHCQACHPLTIKRTVKDDPLSGQVAFRHRQQPAELENAVRSHYTEQFLKGKLDTSPAFLKVPLPGKNPERKEAAAATAAIEKHVAADMAMLLGASTCQKCHTSLAKDRARIEPAGLPEVWLVHAKFDHAAHRAVACLDCHTGARNSQSNTDVLLPAIDNCRQCHAPSRQVAGKTTGGARFDCTECHRYHDGDHPLAGIDAASRQPSQTPR
jgi:hypothetical protein